MKIFSSKCTWYTVADEEPCNRAKWYLSGTSPSVAIEIIDSQLPVAIIRVIIKIILEYLFPQRFLQSSSLCNLGRRLSQ